MTLQLLEFTSKIWDGHSLENVAIIGAQHIMESILYLFRSLKTSGLKPSNTFLIGKCYSSSPSVYHDFCKEGFNVSEMSFAFDSHENFDKIYEKNIACFVTDSLKKINFNNINKLIIIDDGGHLIKYINTFDIPDNIAVVSIEQTSSGINFLRNEVLKLPVINVARSKAKLELETPFVVESSLNRLYKYIPKSKLSKSTVLILGYGVIGAEVANALQNIAEIQIYDPAFSEAGSFLESLKQADIVIGCSGTTSLRYSHYKFLKDGATLISCSSSDREFEAHKFRQLFPKTENCLTQYSNGRITLVQSGFPINFWGSRNNIDLEKIQITLSLLLSSVYQALTIQKKEEKGIIPIDEEAERLIISEFTKIHMQIASSSKRINNHQFIRKKNETSLR